MATRDRAAIPYLKAWRLYRVMSAKDLAVKAKMTEQTIYRLERPGQLANILTVRKLARALEISYEQLLHEEPENKDWAAA